MPKIADYSQQVSPGVLNVPNAPSPNLGVGLSATREIGQANVGLGEAAMKAAGILEAHAQKQLKFQNEAAVSTADTQFRQDIQNRLFDETPQTIKVDGQDVTRPSGVLVRQLGQAHGATVDFDTQYKSMRGQYLSQIKSPEYRASLQSSMDSYYIGLRDNVIKHEATQGQKDLENRFSAGVEQQKKDAYTAQDPASLKQSIDNVALAQDKLNQVKVLDPETSAVNVQKSVLSVAENAVLGTLKTTGNVDQSMALLDSAKDKLTSQNYMDLKEKVSKIGDNLEKQATANLVRQQTENRLNLTMQVATGKLRFDNSNEVIRTVSQSDPDLAEAMKKSIDSNGVYEPTDTNDEAFQKNALDIFHAGTPEEIGNFVVNSLNENGNNKISRDRLAIIVNAAQQRAKNFLPDGTRNNTQIAIDGGMMAVDRWNKEHGNNDAEATTSFLNAIQENKSPWEAYNIAIKNTVTKQHPEVSASEDVPHIVVSKGKPTNYIYTGKAKIAPHRIYTESN